MLIKYTTIIDDGITLFCLCLFVTLCAIIYKPIVK